MPISNTTNEINVDVTEELIEVNTTVNEITVDSTVNEINVHTDPIIIGGGETLPPENYNKMYVQDSVPGTLKEGDQWFSSLTGRIETRADGEWKSVTLDGQSF